MNAAMPARLRAPILLYAGRAQKLQAGIALKGRQFSAAQRFHRPHRTGEHQSGDCVGHQPAEFAKISQPVQCDASLARALAEPSVLQREEIFV
jgi:hypothetical protein